MKSVNLDNFANTKNYKGITLIALIITIVVMLILVAVTVMVTLETGLFSKAKEGTKEIEIEADRETLLGAVAASVKLIDEKMQIPDVETLRSNLPAGWTVEDANPYRAISPNKNIFTVDIYGNIELVEDVEEEPEPDEPDPTPPEEEKIKYTIVPTPSDATIVISSNGVELARGEGTQSVEVEENTNINWTVSRTYYQPQQGSSQVTKEESINVSLQENQAYEHAMLCTSIETVGIVADVDKAMDSNLSDDCAASGSTNASLTWVFVMPDWMDKNAKITNIKAEYKLSTSLPNHSAKIILSGKNSEGTKEFLNTSQDDLSIDPVNGKSYTSIYTPSELLTVSDVSEGIRLEAKKGSDSLDTIRWHGASLTVTYVNP